MQRVLKDEGKATAEPRLTGAVSNVAARDAVAMHLGIQMTSYPFNDRESAAKYLRKANEEVWRTISLDSEWDMERAIEANAAGLALAGDLLSLTKSSRWLLLPMLVSGYLLQHALQGWCPPAPILRRLGFRAGYEIEAERRALLSLTFR